MWLFTCTVNNKIDTYMIIYDGNICYDCSLMIISFCTDIKLITIFIIILLLLIKVQYLQRIMLQDTNYIVVNAFSWLKKVRQIRRWNVKVLECRSWGNRDHSASSAEYLFISSSERWLSNHFKELNDKPLSLNVVTVLFNIKSNEIDH